MGDEIAGLANKQIILDGIYKEPSALYLMSVIDDVMEYATKMALAENIPSGHSREFKAGMAHGLRSVKARVEKERNKNWEALNDQAAR